MSGSGRAMLGGMVGRLLVFALVAAAALWFGLYVHRSLREEKYEQHMDAVGRSMDEMYYSIWLEKKRKKKEKKRKEKEKIEEEAAAERRRWERQLRLAERRGEADARAAEIAEEVAARVKVVHGRARPVVSVNTDPTASRCPYCREACKGSSVEVDCPQCHARIHPECWVESNATCPSCRYSEPAPEARELA